MVFKLKGTLISGTVGMIFCIIMMWPGLDVNLIIRLNGQKWNGIILKLKYGVKDTISNLLRSALHFLMTDNLVIIGGFIRSSVNVFFRLFFYLIFFIQNSRKQTIINVMICIGKILVGIFSSEMK